MSFENYGVVTTKTLRETLGILRWRKQEENMYFKVAPAWITSSGHMESDPVALPSIVLRRAAANSVIVKLPEILTGDAVDAFQKLDIFF